MEARVPCREIAVGFKMQNGPCEIVHAQTALVVRAPFLHFFEQLAQPFWDVTFVSVEVVIQQSSLTHFGSRWSVQHL